MSKSNGIKFFLNANYILSTDGYYRWCQELEYLIRPHTAQVVPQATDQENDNNQEQNLALTLYLCEKKKVKCKNFKMEYETHIILIFP